MGPSLKLNEKCSCGRSKLLVHNSNYKGQLVTLNRELLSLEIAILIENQLNFWHFLTKLGINQFSEARLNNDQEF